MSETFLYFVITVLFLIVLCLAWHLIVLNKTVNEIDEGLKEKLDIDTNTLISISGLDSCTRKMASDINEQMERLRKEKKWIAVIKERTENLKFFTEELFAYSLAYSEIDDLRLETICLNDELANNLANFYGAFKSAGIEPELNFTESVIKRRVDKKAFECIINNLLNNALKYAIGDILVELNDDGSIVISNKTDKMTEVDVERLFERFYTVETANGGTGLGLSIAKMLVEKMNGRIEAGLKGEYLFIKVIFND